MRVWSVSWALLFTTFTVHAACPFSHRARQSRKLKDYASRLEPEANVAYGKAVRNLDWYAVKEDIKKLLNESQSYWPADYGYYGPFMIRLAWHCSGSYRKFDGLGGCGGARIRFDPERSWKDNANLNHALELLRPVKDKYGLGLSWGDLITLTGTTAIEEMGGPVLGYCGGRIDDDDGAMSELLGPTQEQAEHFPCVDKDGHPVENGLCEAPLGPSTIGLIYVNPEGVLSNPVPKDSVYFIRDVFARMGMNDSETVALIGGGHTFGKSHGACNTKNAAGDPPREDQLFPYYGRCGTGKGNDTFTSGIEGPWTTTPTKWDNEYFYNLIAWDWEKVKGPGGHWQWQTTSSRIMKEEIMMMTTDIALKCDPIYKQLAELWAKDLASFNHAFAHAWYKLTTRDVGPVTKCVGPWQPPPQQFQYPLPPPPEHAGYHEVTAELKVVLQENDYGALWVYLAWQQASTYRNSDYLGGANGARIRFPPEYDWPLSRGVGNILATLSPIKQHFGEGISWADLIVLAGSVALEHYNDAVRVTFCPGRTDAAEGSGGDFLQPNNDYEYTEFEFRWKAKMLQLTDKEFLVLQGMPRSDQQMWRVGYSGSWSKQPYKLSNQYFKMLLKHQWDKQESQHGKTEYVSRHSKEGSLYMTPTDLLIVHTPDLREYAEWYAQGEANFLRDFVRAWVKVMTNDRFDGPTGNLCPKSRRDEYVP